MSIEVIGYEDGTTVTQPDQFELNLCGLMCCRRAAIALREHQAFLAAARHINRHMRGECNCDLKQLALRRLARCQERTGTRDEAWRGGEMAYETMAELCGHRFPEEAQDEQA